MNRLRTFRCILALAAVWLLASSAWAEGDAAKTAWIGVRITPVPEALAAHLPLGRSEKQPDVGVMVMNIVADGPAEKAGLKQYDVVIALGHDTITGEFGRFVRSLGKYQPGDKARMTIVRGARRIVLTVEMAASEPALKTQYTYRYPEQPDGVFAERSEFRGAIVTRDGDDWQWQDFGEAAPALFADLPDEVRDRVMKWTGSVAPVNRTTVNQGRRTMELIQNPDGSITVKTGLRDATGTQQTASRTYADADTLHKENPSAYQMYQKVIADPTLQSPKLTVGGSRGVALVAPVDPTQSENAARLLTEAEAYQNEIREYEKFLEQYTEYLRRKAEDPENSTMSEDLQKQIEKAAPQFLPEREFKLHEDGRIDVRIRRPDGDLVISFRDENELKTEYPKLHRQYRRLIEDQSK